MRRSGSRLAGPAAAILALAALGACSGVNFNAEPPPADPNLYPKEYRVQVADFMRTYLENPTQVRDAYISEPALKPVGNRTQYVACVRYNPRDGSRTYRGNQERAAIFLGGRINQFLASTREWCDGVIYQRYPEIEKMVP